MYVIIAIISAKQKRHYVIASAEYRLQCSARTDNIIYYNPGGVFGACVNRNRFVGENFANSSLPVFTRTRSYMRACVCVCECAGKTRRKRSFNCGGGGGGDYIYASTSAMYARSFPFLDLTSAWCKRRGCSRIRFFLHCYSLCFVQ